jgi:hypothetical protein
LLLGDFAVGLQKYEWRWQAGFLRQQRRDFKEPLWVGADDLRGRTILLHHEQGFGDVIQFCRYVPLVAQQAAHVVLQIDPSLQKLMTGFAGSIDVVGLGSALPKFDFHCPLLSLPLAFGTTVDTIPSATPYLQTPREEERAFEARLQDRSRPRIGLFWSGSPRAKPWAERSIHLTSLLPLMNERATFVSLQKEVTVADAALMKERGILDFHEQLRDFSATAGLMAALDLVISIDSSVAHLAGALAKPTWIMLPFPPDWRWLLERSDCPWYPTARLFRQDQTRSWDPVVAQVSQALHGFLAARA